MSMQVSTSQANDEQKTARTASKAKHKLRRGEVFAKYTPSDIPEWAGNQFIECLGRVPTDEELATIMAYKPPYDEAERQRPANVRKQFLNRLKRVFVSLSPQHAIAGTLGELIRSGYEHRAPAQPSFNGFLQRSYEERMLEGCIKSAPDVAPICDSYAIIGVSGVGKLALCIAHLRSFPS